MERRSVLQGKNVLVLAENLYEELELWYPVLRLREEDARVVIAGTGDKIYRGKHGYPVEVDVSVDQVSAGDYHGIIIPGGYAPDRMRRYPAVTRLVREMFDQGKLVAAICHAGWVLVSAGVLEGKRATSFHSIKDDLVNAGARYEDAEVVRDGHLVTSRQPSDLGAFCREIIAVLAEGR